MEKKTEETEEEEEEEDYSAHCMSHAGPEKEAEKEAEEERGEDDDESWAGGAGQNAPTLEIDRVRFKPLPSTQGAADRFAPDREREGKGTGKGSKRARPGDRWLEARGFK